MSDVWSEGYVTGVGYTYGYYRETSPVYQRFCLLLRGLVCNDVDETTAHCELGFGQGVSIAINAAANSARFVGTDFNPAHAAHARDLANHSGAQPAILDDSFEQMLARDDLPAFDSISLHGIWTWVSRDNHKLIAEFAARHLRPGGIFYVSYNCFPGWSPAYPLRQVFALHERYATGSGDVTKRIDAALKFSGALLDARPLFARTATGVEDRLKLISTQSRDYLAHEYFNRDWNCMFFTDVADALATAKLDFATTAEPLDLVDPVNLTAEGIAFLDAIEHPILREQMRDYFVNQQFRRDLYTRGIRRLGPAEQIERTLETRIVLTRSADSVPLKVTIAQGEAPFDAGVFVPLIAELAARDYAPKSFADLRRALPALSLPQLVAAAAVLVGAGHAAPCQSETAERQVRNNCASLNRRLLERARTRDDIHHLASPVTGAGVQVGRFQQLFLLARSRGHDQPEEWARFVWPFLADQGLRLVKDGKRLDTAEDNIADLTERANAFLAREIPILRALGVI
jgi:SAM-dependent methyltransferase